MFLRTASALEDLAVQAESGEFPDISDLKKTVSNLREQEGHLMKERERVLQQRRSTGDEGPGAIDFDAVRAEVGGRLDRLRAAKCAG